MKWKMAEIFGYEPITTFWQDFTIADQFGEDAVVDTYNRVFEDWKDDYKYLTELVIVLNHKIWYHVNTNEKLANTYDKLWKLADKYAVDTLKGDELMYYMRTID